MITYDIDLCLGIDNQGSAITVKCCDTGVNIRAHLYVCRHGKWRDTHEVYTIPEGCTPVLKIAKPDKTFFVKDGTVQANSILFETKPQAFTAAGTAVAEVSLYAETGERITTAAFTINIPPECTSKCEGESGDYVDVMSEQIKAAVVSAEKAEKAAKTASAAAKNAVNASVNPPKLSDKNTWLVWDTGAGAYVDTGICGKGEKGDAGVINFVVVPELPTEGSGDSIYLVPNTNGENNNFDEYIFTDGAWEKIGSASVAVNLDEYVKKTDAAELGGELGLVKLQNQPGYSGITLGPNGQLCLHSADSFAINKKTNYRAPITPFVLDYAVKVGVTTNTETLTAEEKVAACEWLGAARPDVWETIIDYTVPEDCAEVFLKTDINGNPFKLKEAVLLMALRPLASGNTPNTIRCTVDGTVTGVYGAEHYAHGFPGTPSAGKYTYVRMNLVKTPLGVFLREYVYANNVDAVTTGTYAGEIGGRSQGMHESVDKDTLQSRVTEISAVGLGSYGVGVAVGEGTRIVLMGVRE